jgi:hypothetical protein
MKSLVKIACLALIGLSAQAQLNINGHFYGEDLLRFNNYKTVGTAKTVGMGGAFSSLGGDASNVWANPAGLGFYNKSEFSITPIFGNSKSSSTYIDGAIPNFTSKDLKLGQLGVVFSSKGTGSRKKRSAWSLSYTQLANFNAEFRYQGSNNKSSISDYFAERATGRNISSTDLDKEFNTGTGQANNLTAMAYQAFLIAPLKNNAYEAEELSIPVNQAGNVSTSGSLNQINLSYGVNYDNRTYFGLGLGIQSLNHTTLGTLTERFPNGRTFNSFTFSDEVYISGTGMNLNAGVIYKLTENIRIGAQLQTPTVMNLEETYVAAVAVDQKPNTFTTNFPEISTVPNDFNFRTTNPFRASAGASLFLPKKMGVLSLDAEYIDYARMSIKDPEDKRWSSNQNEGIQNSYSSVLNIKAGAELRFGNIRLRGGLQGLSNPIKEEAASNTKKFELVPHLGAGLRTDRYFLDAAFNTRSSNGAFTPYTVSNATDYASVKLNNVNSSFTVSLGAFF